MSINVVLNNQLYFDLSLPKRTQTFIIQDLNSISKSKSNLIYTYATTRYYHDYLKSRGYNISLVRSSFSSFVTNEKISKKLKKINIIEPANKELRSEIIKLSELYDFELEIYFDINYISPDEFITFYNASNGYFSDLFKNLITDYPTKPDEESIYIKKTELEENVKVSNIKQHKSKNYIIDAIKQINRLFPDLTNENVNIMFPINHDDVKDTFHMYLNNGKVEQYEYKEHQFKDPEGESNLLAFDSGLNTPISRGLLSPSFIIKTMKSRSDSLSLSQYLFFEDIIVKKEYIKIIMDHKKYDRKYRYSSNRTLSKTLRDGYTDIEPYDNAIRNVKKTGYINKYVLFKIVINLMLLCEININEIYDWLKIYIPFGNDLIEAKNYILEHNVNGSSYIIQNSNYGYNYNGRETLDNLYDRFIYLNRDEFKYKQSKRSRFLNKNKEERTRIIKEAEQFINYYIN